MDIKRLPPALKIAVCYILVILIGFVLLLLPISAADGIKIKAVDAFFTSASAVCVTGLSVFPDIGATLSLFGKIVLTLLIQIGGLGFVTVAVFLMMALGIKIGVTDRFFIKEALNQNTTRGIIRLIRSIVLTSLVIEALGALGYFFVFIKEFEFWKALGMSVFHSVSAFNNCGFDLLGSSSFIGYNNNILLNLVTVVLIILGGIGFIVIHDVLTARRWKKLSIHSKIVLTMSLILLVFGTISLKLTEGATNGNFTWLQAFFQSVTTRTAGFATVEFKSLNGISILIIMILMFIGASPCSTGGGIKTTTFFTMLQFIKGYARGKKTVAYGRWISDDTKLKAFMLSTLSIAAIMIASIVIMIFEVNSSLYEATIGDILFEATSAFGTVGLSLGITSSLHSVSKLILCVLMFLGRTGPLTIFSLWNKNWNKIENSSVKYIEEKIIIG